MVFFPARGRSGAEKGGGRPREKEVLGGKKRACGTGKIARGERKIVGEWRRAGSGGACRGVAACLRRGPGGEGGAQRCRVPTGRGPLLSGRGKGGGMAAVASVRGEREAFLTESGRRIRRIGGARFRSPAAECGADGGDGPHVFAARMHASCDFPQQGRKKEVFFVRCRAEGLQISFPVLTGRREFRILKQRTVTL